MGMEKFYRTVRSKLGLEKEQLKEEVKQEAVEELRYELQEEVSYIEAQMKEYEQLVAEVNHLLASMRRDRVKKRSEGERVEMDDFGEDLQPLKSKLQKLERSMEERLGRHRTA